jgi:hypothetical protein
VIVLHYLDVMIGFVFTMLVLSLAVTAMVQAVPVYLGNLKGVSLQNGLIDLVLRISHDPATCKKLDDGARGLIDHILRDPLLSPRRAGLVVLARDAWAWLCKLVDSSHVQKPVARARAAVMHREEFVRLLLDFAGTQSKDDLEPVRKQARDLIGVKTAAEARALLVKVRDRVAALELQEPTWSSSRRSDQAMLEVFLASDTVKPFMSKLVGWYDQTIDRVEAAFTARVRNWTTGISFALVLVLQLDSFDLLARLNADSALRDKVVASAIKAVDEGGAAQGAGAAKAKAEQCAKDHLLSTKAAADREAAARTAGTTAKEAGLGGYADCMGLSQATKLGLVTWPDSHEKWLSNWQRGWVPWGLQVTGMFLSLGLLSLGAPFWYEMLSNLIKLRSTIARKDEAAREERQTTQAG